jgi:hypothetical protein
MFLVIATFRRRRCEPSGSNPPFPQAGRRTLVLEYTFTMQLVVRAFVEI